MADLFRSTMKKSEILPRVGDISQLCSTKKLVYTEGIRSGVQVIEVKTGSGLVFTVLPSRGLDISHATFNGLSLSWISATGETSPYFYQPEEYEWLRSFFGGLLTTCGMSYSMHPCEDNGERLGLHGRVSNLPAEDVTIDKKWKGDDYFISISGNVRESKVFGDKLILNRTIETSLGAKSLKIIDRVENAGYLESPLMMLYHVNIGWPVVSEYSRLVIPSAQTLPFDDNARSEPDQWSTFLPPQKDYKERVYLHDLKTTQNGIVNVSLVNDEKEIGVYLRYSKEEFPYFIEWKMMGQGEYVVGIEPGNVNGNRARMREEGTLEFIKPGAERKFSLEIGILYGKNEIEKFIGGIQGETTR
ncbi:aldose 1-epimerase family protein [Candidatus Latescibacterota bacterium]